MYIHFNKEMNEFIIFLKWNFISIIYYYVFSLYFVFLFYTYTKIINNK